MSTELRDVIAQVQRDHTFRITGESDQPLCCECQEGRSGPDGWMLTMEPGEHPAHLADAVLAALREDDALYDRLDKAIENAVWDHERQDGDHHCKCGSVNNMDGDVLPCHRVGAVTQAVRQTLFGEAL